MAKLKSVGAYPDADNALGRNDYTNNRFRDLAVVTGDVTAAMNAAKAPLALKTYVDSQDALYVAKSYVDTQDSALMNANQLGATNGIAQLSSVNKVTAAALRQRAPCFTVHTTYATERSFSSASVLCKTVTVPNPGYPWLPLWTGWTMGRWSAGNYCYPGVSIRHSDGHWVARGWGTGRNLGEQYPINIVPTTDAMPITQAYTGQVTFSIYYTREFGTGTVAVGEASSWFNCLVMPAATSNTPVPIA